MNVRSLTGTGAVFGAEPTTKCVTAVNDRGPRLRLTEGLKCPTRGCEAKISYHSETMWCNSCGWAKNRYPSPGEGYIERKVQL